MSKELDAARELVKMLEEREKANKVELSTLNCGDTFKIGEHDFIVLKRDMQNHTTKVISKGFMAEDVVFDKNTRDYNKSSLKKLIEKDIQPIIENAIGADNLVEHEVDLTSVDMQNEFGKCKCKVRPITFDESREFNDYIVNKNLDDYGWTCTPWSTADRGYKYSMLVVSPSGVINNVNCYVNGGVRPVCILKSNIFASEDK